MIFVGLFFFFLFSCLCSANICFGLISLGPLLDFFYYETEFGHVSESGMAFGFWLLAWSSIIGGRACPVVLNVPEYSQVFGLTH